MIAGGWLRRRGSARMKAMPTVARILLGCAALLASSAASAGDSQLWMGGSATIKLSERWSVSQDMTARFSDQRGGLYEIEANTLVGYQLTKAVSLWAGYDHDPQYLSGHFTVMEHRLVEHLVSSNLGTVAGGQLSGRVRFEQRWREGSDGTGWRLRPYLRYSHPLGSRTKTALVLSAEPYFDLNTTSFQRVRGFERLRSFAGISTPLFRNVSADIGYLNQHGFVRNGKDTRDNVAFIAIGLKL
jgi:hypothetical protein